MRIQVPTAQAIKIIDTTSGGKLSRKGFSIQNVSTQDVYYSDDQRTLDSVSLVNLPLVGHILPGTTPNAPPIVYPEFIGRLFCRSQNAGASLEILIYEIDLPC
jgi:hypothetical protein